MLVRITSTHINFYSWMNKLVIYPQCYYSFLIDVALRYCSLIVFGSSNYSPGQCTPQLNDHGDEQVYVRECEIQHILVKFKFWFKICWVKVF